MQAGPAAPEKEILLMGTEDKNGVTAIFKGEWDNRKVGTKLNERTHHD